MIDLKRKTCLVYDNGIFVEIARRLADDFCRVLYYCPWTTGYPTSRGLLIGAGDEKFERVKDMWDHVDEVDLFVFVDVYEGALQQYLVEKGKRVWGCRMGAELELERAKSKEISAKLGIDIGSYKLITGLDALRKHLKSHDDQYVKISNTRGDMETFHAPTYEKIEPRLDELEHNLGAKKKIMEFVVEDGIPDAIEAGYDGYTIDGKFPRGALVGIEVKDKAYVGRTMRYAQLPESVRGVNDKLTPALKKYGYRGFISTEIRCTDDGKAYLIDPCCFSDDTEILTDQGWKLFQNLDRSETVATLNIHTENIEYQKPTDYVSYEYTGDLISISNKEKGIECLVTPNHGVWRTDRRGNGLFRERADSLSDKGYIPRTGRWKGDYPTFYKIPAYSSHWASGRGYSVARKYEAAAIELPVEAWLRFVAVYLGDGSLHSEWSVNISQKDASKNKDLVRQIVRSLPFEVSENEQGFVVNSVQLRDHLKSTGLCNEKRIPGWIKSLSPLLIDVFLSAYRLCDGGEHKGQKIYYTTSKLLADDLQELIFKAGRLSNVRKRDCAGTVLSVGENTYQRNHDVYIISEVGSQNRFWFETGSRADKYFSKVAYSGLVHDVTVPNGTVYVRRNGKPFWSSNCRCGSPPSELYQNMISNLGEIMWYGAEGIVIEPEYVAKWGAEVLLLSEWADKNWQQVTFPASIRDNVKLRNYTIINGEYYVVPQACGMPEIGAVVATGDTAEAAIAECKKLAKQVEGYYLETPVESLDEAVKDLKEILKMDRGGVDSRAHRDLEEAYRSGKISARQFEKMSERA